MSDKEVRIKITGDISDLMKKLEAIKDSFDDLGSNRGSNKAINNLIDNLKEVEDKAEDVGDKMEDMFNIRTRNNNLDEIADSLREIDDRADEAADSMEKIENSVNDVDTQQYDALERQMKSLYETGSKANDMFMNMGDQISKLESVDIDFSSAKKDISKLANSGDNLGSDLTSGLASGFVTGSMLSKTFDNITSSVDRLVNSINDMKNMSLQDKVELFDQFADDIKTTRKYIDDASQEMAKAEDTATKYAEAMNKSADAVKNHEQRIKSAENRQAAYKKQVSELNDEIDELANSTSKYNKELSKFQQEQSAYEKDLAKYRQEYEALNKAIEEHQQKMNDSRSAISSAYKAMKDHEQQVDENIKKYRDLKKAVDDLNIEYFNTKAPAEDADFEDWIDFHQTLGYLESEIKATEKMMSDLAEETDKMNQSIADQKEHIKELGKEYEELKNQADVFEQQKKNLEAYGKSLDDTSKHIDDVGKELDDKKDKLDNWGQSINKKKKELKDFQQQLEQTKKALDDESTVYNKQAQNKSKYEEAANQVKEYAKSIAEAKEELERLEGIEKKHRDELAKQLGAYEKLIVRTSKFLDENIMDTNVFALEELIKAIEGAHKALDRMMVDDTIFKNIPGGAFDTLLSSLDPGYIKAIIEGAAEAVKELDILDFNNLIKEFDALGEAIEDKMNKTKKLRDMENDYGDETSKQAYGLRKQAEELKAWADTAGYAYKIAEMYNDEVEGIKLEGAIVGNKKALEESLDPKKLREYNKAFSDYMSLIKETGGQVDARYLTDSGAFDVHKFIADLERFGQPVKQLAARYKSLKQQALEYLKVQEDINKKQKDISNAKGYLEEAREAAKAAKIKADAAKQEAEAAKEAFEAAKKAEQAKRAELDAAKKASQGTAEEIANIKKLQDEWTKLNNVRTKTAFDSQAAQDKANAATKEYEEALKQAEQATKKLADAEEDSLQKKYKAVKAVNEYAEALRKLGVEIEGIERSDIEAFDKSLASQLDNTFRDLFDKDIPKNLRELVDDIKAAFSEFSSLELGKGFDLLKDAGKGFAKNVFGNISVGSKSAVGSVAAISAAALKLYDIGQRQFFEGLASAANRLQPVINMLQNLGQEAVAAFEEITDTDVDLSSLMAIGPNFQYQMQQVAAIAGSTSQEFEKLIKKAEHLGGTTKYTASQVGEAFQYMAMAGYSTDEMLESIDGTLALSIASGTDLAETTDIVTDYMTALGMEANSTSEFVDKLAATITSSNTNVKQFGMSMKQVASQAGTLGVSMTDLSTAIGLQANAGVKGQKAGTALKNMLANMNSPTEKQADALKKLGFTLDETTGSYLMTTDGVVDLEKNVKHLMQQIDKMGSLKASALIGQVVGKEALPGVMALLSRGEEAWTELSNTIENSTGKVQFWNECMSITGKSGAEATALIENMKKVFEDTELAASGMNMSTDELAHTIALLGHNGDVTSKNVNDFLDVINSMNTASGKAEETWRSLDKLGNDDVNIGWDYDGTIAKIAADTQGLTQAEKEELKTRLEGVETYEEAKKVAEEYGKELNKQKGMQVDLSGVVERNSFSTMTYADKLKYLRANYDEMGEAAFQAKIQELGLGESMNEIREICKMTQPEFDAYITKLENTKGMAEQLADAMDETTKNALYTLASAIENVAIAAFNSIEPALKGAIDALNEFFDTWHQGEKNEFSFEGLETALADLEQKLEEQKGNIQQAIVDMFTGMDRFINEGAFQSLLDMGTHIIQSICDGIMEAKENGTLDEAIDGLIKKVCDFIITNGDDIREVGTTIIRSISEGIANNEELVNEALDVICDTMVEWANSSATLRSQLGKFSETFAKLAVDLMIESLKEKIKTVGNVLFDPGNLTDPKSGGLFVSTNPWDVFFEGFLGLFDDSLFGVVGYIHKKLKEFWKSIWEALNPKNWFKDKENSKDKEANKVKPEDMLLLPSAAEVGAWIKEKFAGFNLFTIIKNILFGNKNKGDKDNSENKVTVKPDEILQLPSPADIIANIKEKFSGFNFLSAIKEALLGTAGPTGVNATGSSIIKAADLFGNWHPVEDIKNYLSEKISGWSITSWFKEKLTGGTSKEGKTSVGVQDLLKLDTTKLSEIETQLKNLDTVGSTSAQNIITAFTNMTNTARTSFVSMANIVRNQMLSMANVIRNQTTNARNAFTQQFMSMASVARTQMVNITNIVRNQMLNCTNIIRNQVSNMKYYLSQLSSMSAQAKTISAQTTVASINRSSNTLTSPSSNSQLTQQNTLPNATTLSTRSSSKNNNPVNVTLKMNDIEMGKAVIGGLSALSEHSGPLSIPL